MSIKYKLLHQDWTSFGNCKWVVGEWKEATGSSQQPLCTDGWLHYYDHPLLAVLHNPIHGNIYNPIMVEVEIDGATKHEGQMKSGCRRMRVVRQMDYPTITTEQRARYAILCAKTACSDSGWNKWADAWLSGKDRGGSAARYAADAARYAADAASDAARAATYAAYAARYAADAARYAADAAADAARAARAAGNAADADNDLDLIAIAEQAIREER